MTRPASDSILGHHIRNVEHIPGTNDLWLAEATRAVKNPGKGEYRLILIGPETHTEMVPSQGYRIKLVNGYTLRGGIRLHNAAQSRYRIHLDSPQWQDPHWVWTAAHHADVFACDYATARRLLIALGKELVYDRP